MGFIEVNGMGLRYDLVGSAPSTLVLIHEMGGTLESWDLVLPNALGRAARAALRHARRRVIAKRFAARSASTPWWTTWWRSSTRPASLARSRLPALPWVRPSPYMPPFVPTTRRCPSGQEPRHRHRARPLRRCACQGSARSAGACTRSWNRSTAPTRPNCAATRNALPLFAPAGWGTNPASFAAIYRMLAAMDLQPELPRIACTALVIANALDRTRPPALVAQTIPGRAFHPRDRTLCARADARALGANGWRLPRRRCMCEPATA